MATKTVQKGAGRAAAAERTNRHAQRTPLPPRAGLVEAARMAVDTTDAKSQGKASAFLKLAVDAKWQAVVDLDVAGAVQVTATRGPEVIVQAWRGGVWQYDASVYAFADRTTKPRNAAGAVRLLGRPPAVAEAETAKVNSNSSFRKREPKELKTLVLPLDPDLLTDEEATKYFRGRTVQWYNRQSRRTETAMVSRTYPVRVTRYAGEVTICVCGPGTGFRAFHLSAVLAVGRGTVVVHGDTVEVEMETEDAA